MEVCWVRDYSEVLLTDSGSVCGSGLREAVGEDSGRESCFVFPLLVSVPVTLGVCVCV